MDRRDFLTSVAASVVSAAVGCGGQSTVQTVTLSELEAAYAAMTTALGELQSGGEANGEWVVTSNMLAERDPRGVTSLVTTTRHVALSANVSGTKQHEFCDLSADAIRSAAERLGAKRSTGSLGPRSKHSLVRSISGPGFSQPNPRATRRGESSGPGPRSERSLVRSISGPDERGRESPLWIAGPGLSSDMEQLPSSRVSAALESSLSELFIALERAGNSRVVALSCKANITREQWWTFSSRAPVKRSLVRQCWTATAGVREPRNFTATQSKAFVGDLPRNPFSDADVEAVMKTALRSAASQWQPREVEVLLGPEMVAQLAFRVGQQVATEQERSDSQNYAINHPSRIWQRGTAPALLTMPAGTTSKSDLVGKLNGYQISDGQLQTNAEQILLLPQWALELVNGSESGRALRAPAFLLAATELERAVASSERTYHLLNPDPPTVALVPAMRCVARLT